MKKTYLKCAGFPLLLLKVSHPMWSRSAVGLGGTGLALLLAACNTGDAEESVGIATATVERRDLRITAEATGELEPVRKVEVKSKASGEILKLYVDSGDKVEPGSLLATVDPRDVENAHDQAVADLDVAQARVSISQAQLDRSKELLNSEVITAQEYESRELEHANAQAALVRATTNLELAELRLTDVTIGAPMAGTILEKQVEDGQVIQSATGNVSGGTTLFVMANLDDMRVRTLVDETDMGQLTAGMTATVSVEAFPDRTFTGEIEKIEPQAVVVQNVTMFPVIILLDNRAGLLKPGMNAEVEVLVNERLDVITVPNNTVVQPQEVAPAAEILGLDPQVATVDRAVWREIMTQAAALSGAGGVGTASAAGGPPGAMMNRRGQGQSEGPPSARPEGMQAGSPSGGSQFAGNFGRAATGGSTGDPAFRPGVAFVVAADGTMESRPVVIGLSDWDYSQIVVGLEEGEQVALIGAAQLQAQQQERIERIRGRMGGGPF